MADYIKSKRQRSPGYIVNSFECGCRIESEFLGGMGAKVIEYCPQHKAAPDMYEALKELMQAVDEGQERIGAGRGIKIGQILSKAEGKYLKRILKENKLSQNA